MIEKVNALRYEYIIPVNINSFAPKVSPRVSLSVVNLNIEQKKECTKTMEPTLASIAKELSFRYVCKVLNEGKSLDFLAILYASTSKNK